MKRVVVRVSDNYSLDSAAAAILKLYGYLTFVEQFRSFSIITFDCPDKYSSGLLERLNALGPVKKCTWDADDKFSVDPVDTGATLTVDNSQPLDLNTTGETTASSNTRNLTTSGSGTIYVKVQNFSGNDLYVFSSSPSGTYSLYANQTGFAQGGTYTFDQSDSSNSGHPFRFSITPDGTHTTGGTEYTTGVSTTGTPGTDGTTVLTVSASSASILFFYCTAHPNMGRYSYTTISRYGTVNIHDFWHLDRITKQDRQYLNGTYSYNQTGDGVDIYVIDTGVRGASRPTGNNAALHPELYDPDFVSDLNGASEQQNYRVFQMSHYAGSYGSNNEDDNGHGTYCAILSAGRTAGISKNAKIYAAKAFSSTNSGSFTAILSAYQAVIDHNDSGNGNYKGNTRPAIINASFGPTIPSQPYPYVELNDAGDDSGTDEEILDDIEGTISSSHNIIVCRSAGNGFKNYSDVFAGPMQTKAIAGSRTAGYADNATGGINTVDVDQKKICVGATEYNDRWADFSNYGSGVTTVAPGARILSPSYDWTANTPYTSSANYSTINGTSFSCPIVSGIIAAWCGKNGFTLSTNNIAGQAKEFIRGTGATGDITKGGHVNYPINSIEDKKLPSNPFETSNGSDFIVVSFNSSDAAHFIGNVGKKVQLRTTGSTGALTVGGVDLAALSQSGWLNIQAESAVNNTITIQASSNATASTTGGGDNNYLALINVEEKYHEGTDGVVGTATTLRSQTDVQEAAGTGTYTNVIYYPVDSGVDFKYDANTDTLTTKRGVFFPYVDSSVTWQASSGAITGTPFANGASVSIDIGLVGLTFANEPTLESYSLSGDSIAASGLALDTSTGVLSGTVTADYVDTTFNFTVTENITGSAQSYSFTTSGTGVLVNITQQPTAQSVEAGSGNTASFGPVAGISSDGSTITFQWQFSSNGGVGWSNVSNGGGYSGATTNTLVVDDDFAKNTYQYRCELDTITAVTPSYTNAVALTVFRTITISNQPVNSTPVAPATASFSVTASTLDSAALSYQWQKSENGDGVIYGYIMGATSATYTTGSTTYDDSYGDYYRCVLSAAGASNLISSVARSLVTRTISVTAQPTGTTGAVGGTEQFGVAATTSDNDAGDITFQWQVSITSGASWSDVTEGSGGTTATYTTPTLTTAYDAYQYRCLLACPGATTIPSNAATLQVETVTVVVSTQPTPQTVNENATATFTTLGDVTMQPFGGNAASSSFDTENFTTPSGGGGGGFEGQSHHEPSVTYQWEKSDDAGSNWSTVAGATSASYTTAATTYAADNQDEYRCKLDATGAAASAYTNAVALTVQRTFSITAQPSNPTANEGATAAFSITATSSSGTPTYQWERSDDNGSNYASVGGATSASYTTPTLVHANDDDDRYRCVVSLVGSAAPITSDHGLLTVLRVINVTQQPVNTSVIEGQAATFSITASITSDVIAYQWQISINGGGAWSNINGANASSYTTPVTTFPTSPSEQFRCSLSNAEATSVTSNAVTLTVNESEFVSGPATVTPTVDSDTNKTLSRQPIITTSAFIQEYAGSTHYSTFWRIRRTSDNVTVYDTSGTFVQGDTGNLTTFTVPVSTLDFDTAYFVQVKFRDNNGLESAYSAAANFSTPIVDQPDIQTITPAFNPVIDVNAIALKSGYQHSSSDWQFAPNVEAPVSNPQFTTILHQSLGNSTNLVSYTLPGNVNLDANTTYLVRIRFNVNPI